MSQQSVVTVCESMYVCTGMETECHNSFCTCQKCSRCCQKLAVTLYMLVARTGRDAWQRFVASIHVKKLGEDNGKVGEQEEIECST